MLVLSRKTDESIRIGNNIIVKVLKTTSGHVKLGIEAPKDIPVHREEIYNKIKKENKESLLSENYKHDMLDKAFENNEANKDKE